MAWQPSYWHCTSLHIGEPDPQKPPKIYCSRGLAIVTSDRFEKVYLDFLAGKITEEEAEEAAFAEGDDPDDNEDE